MKPPALPSSQQGYAVLFFLFFIGAVALGIYSLYDSGWVASERIRLQNTADNTTYSTVNMVARDMNMMAISNRGMIANQVMVGQLVALSSWGHYVRTFAESIKTVTSVLRYIPYIGAIIDALATALESAATYLSQGIDAVAGPIIKVQDNYINEYISRLQNGYHLATYAMVPDVYQRVLEKNDENAEINTVAQIHNVAQFLNLMKNEFKRFDEYKSTGNISDSQQEENERVAQFAQLINDSRDGFTADRTSASSRPTVFVGGTLIRGSINVRGGTDFIKMRSNGKTGWGWTSLDAASFNLGYYDWLDGWDDYEIPMGYGAAHALNENRQSDYFNYSGNSSNSLKNYEDNGWRNVNYTQSRYTRYWQNPFKGGSRSTRVAANIARSRDGDNNLARITGVRPFYDFKSNDARAGTEALTLVFSKKTDSFRLQKNLADDFSGGYVSDDLNVSERGGVPGDRILAISSARIYFERPTDQPLASSNTPWSVNWGRHDDLHEYGNLYNPFWETRLEKTDNLLIQLAVQALGST